MAKMGRPRKTTSVETDATRTMRLISDSKTQAIDNAIRYERKIKERQCFTHCPKCGKHHISHRPAKNGWLTLSCEDCGKDTTYYPARD